MPSMKINLDIKLEVDPENQQGRQACRRPRKSSRRSKISPKTELGEAKEIQSFGTKLNARSNNFDCRRDHRGGCHHPPLDVVRQESPS